MIEAPNDLLFEAIQTFDLAKIDRALTDGANPDVRNEEGDTPLALAIRYRFEEAVARLIKAGASVDGSQGSVPLLTLITHPISLDEENEPNDRIVEMLLKAGADPRLTAYGWSALGGCCGLKGPKALRTAELLLRYGTDPNYIGASDTTPLMDAAREGALSMVELLLDYGADPNRLLPETHDGPLNLAQANGHLEVVDRLLKAGATEPALIQTDLRTAVVWGDALAVRRLAPGYSHLSTLLFDALFHGGRAEIVATLLELGADPNFREGDEEFYSVLEAAVNFERPKALRVLLEWGADPFRYGREGETMAAAGEYGTLETLSDLLDRGIPVDAGDSEGTTALMNAARNGHVEAVLFLIERGAEVNRHALNNHPDGYGGATALLDAVKMKNIPVEIVRILLEAGADPEEADAAGNTAIMWAAWEASAEVVRLLLSYGVNVNALDIYSRTALDGMDISPNEEKRALLVEAGAIRGDADDDGTFRIVRWLPRQDGD